MGNPQPSPYGAASSVRGRLNDCKARHASAIYSLAPLERAPVEIGVRLASPRKWMAKHRGTLGTETAAEMLCE